MSPNLVGSPRFDFDIEQRRMLVSRADGIACSCGLPFGTLGTRSHAPMPSLRARNRKVNLPFFICYGADNKSAVPFAHGPGAELILDPVEKFLRFRNNKESGHIPIETMDDPRPPAVSN